MSALTVPLARPAGYLADTITVALRALRQLRRDAEAVLPSLFVGVFFYGVQVGALQDVFEGAGGGNGPGASGSGVLDYKAFLLPMGIMFAVTGQSRAMALVTDIQGGYFDRLLVTPVRRSALLLGLMAADLLAVLALASAITIFGLVIGVEFTTGPLGIAVFLSLCGLWGLAFAGFPYAVALRTGNPSAVGTSWLLFMPFAFLTTAFVPQEAMTGWMAAATRFNPVTYLLEALRSLILGGWDIGALARGFGAVAAVFALTFSASLLALRRRVQRQ